MKRTFCIFLLLALLLTGCASKNPTEHRIDIDGNIRTVTLDPAAQTVTDGDDVYHYTVNGNDLQITYPNGAVYEESGSSISWYGNYDSERYLSGFLLSNVIQSTRSSPDEPAPLICALLLFALGLFGIVSPRGMWYLSYGWHYKDAEPSDTALTINRVGGVGFIILSIIVLALI